MFRALYTGCCWNTPSFPPRSGAPGCRAAEKVAAATFSKELHEFFASISDEIVGKNFMQSVIFEAHVPENDGFSFDSVICG